MARATKKPIASRARTIFRLSDDYRRSKGVILCGYSRLNVADAEVIRTRLDPAKCRFTLVKNTLLRIGLGHNKYLLEGEVFHGPTAAVFIWQNEVECAKEISEICGKYKDIHVKGAIIAGRGIDANELQAIGEIPSREVLLSQIIGLIAAPLVELVGTVEATYATPIRTIYAVSDNSVKSLDKQSRSLAAHSDYTGG